MTGKWMTVALGGVVAALALSACSGSADASQEQVTSTPSTAASEQPADAAPTPEAGKVTVEGVGAVTDQYGMVAVYATVVNPTTDKVLASVSFAGYDAAGTVLGTTSSSAPIVAAGDKQQVVTYLSVPDGAQVASTTAQVEIIDSSKDEHPTSRLTPAQVTVQSDDYSIKVTGTLDSAFDQSFTNPGLNAVCTDAAGAVVAAGFTFGDGTVVPGQPYPYSISLTGAAPATCVVTAGVTNLSEAS
ncbi:hypothetical protein Cch01nite_17320 [Cellulomonas chitinilytica]|uniref:Lipoprotein n=1 Tax=Cellulomonas chitinilytica TaxID=398759 RepID=A0A919TZM3_9CELL|nr:FxLYD domain-containing protein [Cellulomonas chitinilytica]GIG21008.1 hypothetical protein Cch01nite_17320 [Cellulomonas chitinilytica]